MNYPRNCLTCRFSEKHSEILRPNIDSRVVTIKVTCLNPTSIHCGKTSYHNVHEDKFPDLFS